MQTGELEKLVMSMSRLPGMGDRSATRVVVHLLKQQKSIMGTLIKSLTDVYEKATVCQACNNIDITSPCAICSDKKRDRSLVCVVADISDLWSIERAGFFCGVYHILGGKLSAMDGVLPSDLETEKLCSRLQSGEVQEVILAMSADLDGQTTLFFVQEKIKDFAIKITTLSHGIPIGWDLDYLDNGTIMTAFNKRLEF